VCVRSERDEGNVSSYWKTLKKGEETGCIKRHHEITFCEELTIGEVVGLL